MLLFLLILMSSVTYAQDNQKMQEYLDKELPKTIEAYKKTQVPDFYVPLFKVVNRFQGSTIFLDNQNPTTVPMSVTMIDIQFMRYSPLFGILRFYTQTPMKSSSYEDQLSDPFLKNLNNTTIGIASGGGWHVYDSRKADTGKGLNISIAFFGFYNIGVANKTMDDNDHTSNGGAEVNFRIEQFVHRNVGIVYGFDVGFSTLHYKELDPSGNLEQTLGTISIHYGAVIGLAF